MSRRVVPDVVVIACIAGALAGPLAAQQPTPSADSLRTSLRQRLDSARTLALQPHATRTCPMPVAIPDLSRSERMPVAPTDPRGHFLRVVPTGCPNPLFRRQGSDTLFVPTELLRSSDSAASRLFRPWRRDTIWRGRSPLHLSDSIPGLRLPLAPLPPAVPPR